MAVANSENAVHRETGLPANQPDLRPIQLKWDGGHVVVTPEDEDRFVKESVWAVGACQQMLAVERMAEQLKTEFFPMVRRWCEDHADRLETCVVALSPTVFMVFVVTKNRKYDFSLSDALADLEMELAQKSWPAEVLQIPDGSTESLQTFFDPEKAILVYERAAQSIVQRFVQRVVGRALLGVR
jgi:hypothetical protein